MARLATLSSPAPIKALVTRLRPPVAEPLPLVYLQVLPQRLVAPSKKEAAEVFLASLHTGIGPLLFEIVATGGRVAFRLACRPDERSYVESQLAAQYPGVQLPEIGNEGPTGEPAASTAISLALPDATPLRQFASYTPDPLAPVLAALSALPPDQTVRLCIVAQREPDGWQPALRTDAARLRAGQPRQRPRLAGVISDAAGALAGALAQTISMAFGQAGSPAESTRYQLAAAPTAMQLDLSSAIEEKARWAGFRTAIRVDVWAGSRVAGRQTIRALEAALDEYTLPYLNRLVARPLPAGDARMDDNGLGRRGFILSIPELASLWHLPGNDCNVAGVSWGYTRQAEPPASLPADGCTLLGRTAFRTDGRPFGLLETDRFRHLYVIGKAGGGKSTVLKNMVIQDMRRGYGLALLDPHGDLYDDLLDYIPPQRIRDVVLLDPGDQDYPVSLNPLELPDLTQKAQVASALVDILKRSFEHSWGPRLEYILRNCILTLLEVPNSTIMGIPRLLSDDGYRAWAVAKVQDPVMCFFWQREFAGMLTNPRLVTEAISPVQNKVGQFLAAPLLRHILAQPKSTVNMQDIMDTSKILLVNLAKGRIGEDSSSLLGAMIVSSIHFAAMRRVSQREHERRPFFLYADEFQSFATSTFASILSESRKYRLGLILAHQYLTQLPDEVRQAIFGNVGSLLAFTVGPDDARFLEHEFASGFSAQDLMNLERYQMAARLMVDGSATPAFSAAGLPPFEGKTGLKDKAIATSRAQYARDVATVEEKIRTWSERVYAAPRGVSTALSPRSTAADADGRFPLLGEAAAEPATDQMGERGE